MSIGSGDGSSVGKALKVLSLGLDFEVEISSH
jgi:hypothetical protein